MTPRLLSGAAAAAYCGVTPTTFAKWAAGGIVPKPIPNTRRWDRKALDLALDKAAGIATPNAVADQGEDEWERKYEARKAASGAGSRHQAAR